MPTLRTALLTLVAVVREIATSVLSIPGRVRFRLMRAADRAEQAVREDDAKKERDTK